MRPPHRPPIEAGFLAACLLLSSCSGLRLGHDPKLVKLAALEGADISAYIKGGDRVDPVLSYYRDGATRGSTLAFFASIAGSEEIARLILDAADEASAPAGLAFAVAFEESGFDAKAYNRNADTVDRGLFQLNSKSFPALKVEEFYDPAVNARAGVDYLRRCLRAAGNEVAALAMYNAGHGKVSRGATPRSTLDYVYRIQKYRDGILDLFEAKVAAASRGFLPRLALGFIQEPPPLADRP